MMERTLFATFRAFVNGDIPESWHRQLKNLSVLVYNHNMVIDTFLFVAFQFLESTWAFELLVCKTLQEKRRVWHNK